MKTVMIYKSKSGFVKKYANWIAAELNAELFEADDFNPNNLVKYDVIIYGGGLYAVGINGVKLIKNNLDKMHQKRLIVFASGAAPAREKVVTEVFHQNFTKEQQKYVKFFYLRGGFDYNKLSTGDKVLMKLLKWKIHFKKSLGKQLEGDEIGMLQAYSKPADFTNKDNIKELVRYASS